MSRVKVREFYHVNGIESPVQNNFSNYNIPQNPGLSPNNTNGSHQDSWCSESVSCTGPTDDELEIIRM